MGNAEGSGLGRLRDDPKAAAIIEEFERAASGDSKLEACFRLAEHLMLSGRNEQARQALEIGREFARSQFQQAELLRRQAELLFRESRFEEAAQALERAIVGLGGRPEPMELFRIYRLQAMVYFRQGYLERAQSFADGAQAILTSVPEKGEEARQETDLAWAELYHLMALLDGAAGDYESAVRHYDREIDILEDLGRDDRLGTVYNNISGLLKTRDSLARALEYQLRSYRLAEQSGDALSLAISCNNLGEIYHSLGDLDLSQDFYLRYLEINHRISNRMGDAFGQAGLARVAAARGDLSQAEKHLRAAIEVAGEVKGLGRESSLQAELAELLGRQGRHQEATQALDRAIALSLETQAFNSQRHQIVGAGIKLAQAGEASGPERKKLLDQARDLVEGALASPMAVEDEEPYSVSDLEREARKLLAEIWREAGDRARAAEEADRAWAIVMRTLGLLPEKYRSDYLAKPEVREVEMLRKLLEEEK